jgi:hypothetical protein
MFRLYFKRNLFVKAREYFDKTINLKAVYSSSRVAKAEKRKKCKRFYIRRRNKTTNVALRSKRKTKQTLEEK